MNNKVFVKVYAYGIKYNLYGKVIAIDVEIYTIECLPEQLFYSAKAVAFLPDFLKYDRVELRWQFQGERFMYHYTKVDRRMAKTFAENTPHKWA